MGFNLRNKSGIFMVLNILSFILLFISGMVLVGPDFFQYLGRGVHYVYYFLFNRAFDFKTVIVIIISLLVISFVCTYMIGIFKRDSIRLKDLVSPIAAITVPYLILAAIRGKTLGAWNGNKVAVVLTIVFLVIYVISSVLVLAESVKVLRQERGIDHKGLFRRKKKFSLFDNAKMSGGKRARETISKTFIYIILVIMSIVWISPFVYLVIQSFAVKYEAGLIIPQEWTFNNYKSLINDTVYPFWRWYLNTFVIALIVSVLNTVLTLISAYAFSRLQFKTRKGYMKMILIIGMFPGFLGMIVTYYMLKQVGLANDIPGLFGLVLVYISGCVMNYYVAKGFFDTISRSLDEAAMIDGANKNTIFWKVIMPLSKPIVVYTILLAFTAPWGDYMLASVMAGGKTELFNVAVGLQQMLSKEAGTKYFPVFCAAGVVVSIPIMILFFLLQGYYVEGVTGGAVKG